MVPSLYSVSHKVQRAAVSKVLDAFLAGAKKDRQAAFLRIINFAQKFWPDYPDSFFEKMREDVRNNSRWVRVINDTIDDLDPHVVKVMAMNLGYEAFLRGTKMIRKNRKKYHCNIPWIILFDPTSACNLHCKGCWAGTYGRKYNLSFEDMDSIITQGKRLGTYLYLLTGGEPTVRKKDLIRLAEKHDDIVLAMFTNSTLIDEDFAKEAARLGNFVFFLSIEGTPETNDARRGEGHYDAVMKAMDLLRKYGVVYASSVCYTRANIEAVTSDDFLQMIADKGARFGFFFHYMPVGNSAVPELLPTMEQRKNIYKRLRYIRSDECDLPFFPLDFQNDGEYVGGCVAGGRNYFHINSNGDAEPCAFIHYSDSNIHDKSNLEILRSPLFMAYHKGQPFNKNHLRPCPMLENPEALKKMVHETGAHSTDLESPEPVEHLCAKCEQYAKDWAGPAQEIWDSKTHPVTYDNYYHPEEEK